jgi:hypothetical protein
VVAPELRRLDAGFTPQRFRFDLRSGYVGFVVDKATLERVSSKYFRFHCQFSLRQMLYTHPSSGTGTIGQLVAGIPNGLSLTPPQEKIIYAMWCRRIANIRFTTFVRVLDVQPISSLGQLLIPSLTTANVSTETVNSFPSVD